MRKSWRWARLCADIQSAKQNSRHDVEITIRRCALRTSAVRHMLHSGTERIASWCICRENSHATDIQEAYIPPQSNSLSVQQHQHGTRRAPQINKYSVHRPEYCPHDRWSVGLMTNFETPDGLIPLFLAVAMRCGLDKGERKQLCTHSLHHLSACTYKLSKNADN